MITIQQARTLTPGQYLYFLDRHTGARILHCRVNGAVKFWKTRPTEFRIPVKYGLYEYAYIGTTADSESPDRFHLTAAELEIHLAPVIKGRLKTKAQVAALNNLLK